MNYGRPKPFDSFWQLQLLSALDLLRTAADRWSARGLNVLNVEDVLTVLVQELSAPWGLEHGLDERLREIETLETIIRRLAPRRQMNSAELVVQELCEMMQAAAESWVINGSESPPTEQVLLLLTRVLFRYRLVRRPPPASV